MATSSGIIEAININAQNIFSNIENISRNTSRIETVRTLSDTRFNYLQQERNKLKDQLQTQINAGKSERDSIQGKIEEIYDQTERINKLQTQINEAKDERDSIQEKFNRVSFEGHGHNGFNPFGNMFGNLGTYAILAGAGFVAYQVLKRRK